MSESSVAFQGIGGSFHERGAELMFGPNFVVMPRSNPDEPLSFEDVFDAVESGRAHYGVVAVESNDPNLAHFSKVDTLLATRNVWVSRECYLDVPLCLIGAPGTAKLDLKDIENVYSQPEALIQIERWRKAHIPKAGVHEMGDTAYSVKYVVERGKPGDVAVARAEAAQLYGGELLVERINNKPRPRTRFFAFGLEREVDPAVDQTALHITANNIAGSLGRILDYISENNINMTRIDNHPVFEDDGTLDPMHQTFFLNIGVGINSLESQRFLRHLAGLSCIAKVIGSFVSAPTTQQL